MFSFFYYFISLLISLFFYFIAPKMYDYTFCLLCFFLFLINSVIFVRWQIKRLGLLNFHVFFLISYFFINIFYAIFVYPIDPQYFFIFQYGFDDTVICKSLALAVFAIQTYFLVVYSFSSGKIFDLEKSILFSENKKKNIIFIFVFIFILLFFLLGQGFNSFSNSYVGGGIDAIDNPLYSPLLSFFEILLLLIISFLYLKIPQQKKNVLFDFLKANIKVLAILITIAFIFLLLGSRTLAIKIILPLVCLYSLYVKRVSGKIFILGLLLGVILMGTISRSRVSDDKIDAINSFVTDGSAIDLAMDLVIVNRNLLLAVEDVNKNGVSFGIRSSKSFFSFFPYYPPLASKFGLGQKDIDSEVFFTDISNVSGFSVGSNMIGDLYMILGLPSVFLGMILFAIFISIIEIKSRDNLYWLYIYSLILSFSILFSRFNFFFISRSLIWGIVVIYLMNNTRLKFK